MVDLENNNLNISLLAEENISSALINENLQVVFDTSANISIKPALSYIKSGQKEISDYVSDVAEPRLSEYVQTAENQMQNCVDAVQKFADDIVDKGFVKTADLQNALEGKQDVISDLPAIRNGATLGATALQPSALNEYATKNYVDTSKADTDLSNINTAGKSFASGLAMPSSRYIDLTLGASGASYTAPANGWIFLRFDTGSGTSFITIVNNGLIADQSICEQAHAAINKLFIVPKGEYKLYYHNITPVIFRFVYAGGEA